MRQPPRPYLGKIVNCQPELGRFDFSRVEALVPDPRMPFEADAWDSLGEFASYDDAKAAIVTWWRQCVGKVDAEWSVLYVSNNAPDYDGKDWWELRHIGGSPPGEPRSKLAVAAKRWRQSHPR